MPIRIVHTADNHLGISFRNYPESVRQKLLQERLDSITRLIEMANERKAHFVVVAGDLFDRITVPKQIVEAAVNVLKRFEGHAVLVLAGNHDYYEGNDSVLWTRFQKAAENTCVQALLECKPETFETDGGEVIFYPCPCPSKYGTEPMIGWVNEIEKKSGAIHIGIAHGNVEGLGLDGDQRYFNMTERGLRETGMHTWLLGHIHVASPAPGITGRQTFYMSGIHAPDSVKSTRPGHAWFLEIGTNGTVSHTSLQPGKIQFKRITRELRHGNDVEALRRECNALDLANTVLDLQLTGRLNNDDLAKLTLFLEEIQRSCLHLSDDRKIHPMIDAIAIDAMFPKATLPHRLLNSLATDEEHPQDVHLALELINELQRS